MAKTEEVPQITFSRRKGASQLKTMKKGSHLWMNMNKLTGLWRLEVSMKNQRVPKIEL
jgi:hypothetical protein